MADEANEALQDAEIARRDGRMDEMEDEAADAGADTDIRRRKRGRDCGRGAKMSRLKTEREVVEAEGGPVEDDEESAASANRLNATQA